MRMKMRIGISLVVVSLLLTLAQALVWKHSVQRGGSETQKIDVEVQNPPTEIPGVAGMTLLIAAGVWLSVVRTDQP
jgi:hypothetical protein